ncbi:MAG: hypothetical protein RSB90_08200 [Eubacterium sp.]
MHHTIKNIHFILLFIFVCLILLSGCSKKEIVNNTDTGEIFTSNPSEHFIDGTYTASSKYYDPTGYGLKMTINVKHSIITHTSYQEINAQGVNRLSDPTAKTTWPESDLKLGQIYTKLYTNFINKQKPEFDTISGATQTIDHFKKLALVVYNNAKTGETTPTKVNNFVLSYTAEGPVDESGYHGKLTITFDGDTITQIIYDEYKDTTIRSGLTLYKQLYNVFTKETLQRQNLTALDIDPLYPVETMKYNELLQSIANQRILFNPV